jgi:uncharacterized protein YdiU (UPF0061 family)
LNLPQYHRSSRKKICVWKQGQISQWNLWQLANALHPIIKDEKFLEDTLNRYGNYFWEAHDAMLCRKFGFDELRKDDEEFFTNWQGLMQELQLDHTLFFNQLEKLDLIMIRKNYSVPLPILY